MKNQSSNLIKPPMSPCCSWLLKVLHVEDYGIQYCSRCGQPAADLNRPMFAKMALVDPGLYEQARGVLYSMIQEQRPPPKPEPAPKLMKEEFKPRVGSYYHTSSTADSSGQTWFGIEFSN